MSSSGSLDELIRRALWRIKPASMYNEAAMSTLISAQNLCKEYAGTRALENLSYAIQLDAKYKEMSKKDEDFKNLWDDEDFKKLTG